MSRSGSVRGQRSQDYRPDIDEIVPREIFKRCFFCHSDKDKAKKTDVGSPYKPEFTGEHTSKNKDNLPVWNLKKSISVTVDISR